MPKKIKKNKVKKVEPIQRMNNYEEVPLQIKIKDELKNDKKIQPSKIFEKYNDKKIKINKSSKNGSM
mgnify:CR=1 FL=1